MLRRLHLAVLAIALLAASCGGGDPAHRAVLAEIAADTIVPIYDRMAEDAIALETAVVELCDDPSADGLAAADEALRAVRATWSESEPVWLGPVMSRRSWGLIDWPISEPDIEALIADTDIELDEDRLSRRIAADQRGLGAVEYVLGDPAEPDERLEALAEPRRCDYLTGVAGVIRGEAELLPTEWTTGIDDVEAYVDVFEAEEEGSVDMLVNDAVFLLEAISDAELGRALGETVVEADSSGIVEGPAGLGAADIAAHLLGLRAVLVGGLDTGGLEPLIGDDLDDRLTAAFDDADAAIAAIDGPLLEAIADRPETVAAVRDAVKVIQVLVSTEVVSRLGVTIGFSDADGDTGG